MPWLDAKDHPGGWVDADRVSIAVGDRGLLLGDGIFDTSMVLGGRMVWRTAHVSRLVAACSSIDIEIDRAKIDAGIDAALARTENGSMRITVTRGSGPRGLAPTPNMQPTLLVTTAPLRAAAVFAPLKLSVAAIRRNETSPLAGLKSLNYLDGVLVARDALRSGCDDAVVLNTQGAVACTSVGNIFALKGATLVTPPLSAGVLDGVVRRILLHSCADIDVAVLERPLTLAELCAADAVLCTNSLRLVAEATTLDRKVMRGSRLVAALAGAVAQEVVRDVGVDPRRFRDH